MTAEEIEEKFCANHRMAEIVDYKEGPTMASDINRELDDATRSTGPQPETRRPRRIDCNAEELITIYGSLQVYLKVLTQQPDEDLETIARVTRLMIAIKPQAVEASQEIARRET
jgi:hypothetical protein